MSEITFNTFSILRPDNMVYVDGVAKQIDCSKLDPLISAVQWRGKSGWIEYLNAGGPVYKPNEDITDLAPFQEYVAAWFAA